MDRFHEDLGRKHMVEGSGERAFGLTVGGILVLIGAVRFALFQFGWLEIGLCIVGLTLVALALMLPRLLAPLNRAWTKLGLFLFKIVSPLVLGLIYFIAVVPTGLIMRLSGKDVLRLKFDPKAKSYWIERKPPGPAADTMKRQF